MSATIHHINAAHKSEAERLLSASLQIIRLETSVTMLEMALTHAITCLKIKGETESAAVLEAAMARASRFLTRNRSVQ